MFGLVLVGGLVVVFVVVSLFMGVVLWGVV